jgi:histidine triad (HIT) family protein
MADRPAHLVYDEQNVFARILRGEVPCHKVTEDDRTFAFMDIMPMTRGHVLVLPKAKATTIYDIGAAELGDLFNAVRRIALAARQALAADGVTIQQFNEPAGGQTVFHMHVHVLPRWTGVPLRAHSGEPEDSAVLADLAEQIRQALV